MTEQAKTPRKTAYHHGDLRQALLAAAETELAAFMILVEGVGALRGDDPLASARGRADVAAAWSVVHGIANLLIAGRMGFIKPMLDADFEATVAAIVGRALPL